MSQEDWLNRVQERERTDEARIMHLEILLEGQAISHVGLRLREVWLCGCRTRVGSIGGVATEPEYRRRGLATRLMERAIRRIDEEGGDLMLVSGDRGLYRRLHCVPAGKIHRVRLSRAEAEGLHRPGLELKVAEPADFLDFVALYEKEPVRWHRSWEDFQWGLKHTPAPAWTPTNALLVRRKGETLGYLIVQEPARVERGRGQRAFLSEYAGVRSALLGAVSQLFTLYPVPELVFHVPAHDAEMLYLLADQGIASETSTLPGHTFKVINLPRLMERLEPYLQGRLREEERRELSFQQEGETFRLAAGGETLELAGGEIEPVIFGPPEGPGIPQSRPLPLGGGKLHSLLSKVFPLPFPWPGLDTI
ncbi:MAG TPA: GNAT family N-acetyltransferase [Armatimonadetes bacterium]|nr:GNAT family N-acetyltransferase [Armatimonadota bacterium]